MNRPDVADILVLSDTLELSRAVTVNLLTEPGLQVWNPVDTADPALPEAFALIIVALASPSSEPVSVLGRAGLANHVGQTPLLIIHPQGFQSDPAGRIFCLEFPFEVENLRKLVQEIVLKIKKENNNVNLVK